MTSPRAANSISAVTTSRRGQEALWFYQTQDGNHQQGYLALYDKLPRREAYPHLWLLDWAKHEGWNEHPLQ